MNILDQEPYFRWMKKQACIYCASSDKIAEKYHDGARKITEQLSKAGYQIIYGGGAKGLMGTIANRAIELKTNIIGVIPEFMKAVEWDHPLVENMEVVNDMHERKQRFLIDTDVVIALPGGCGTFEELLEAITLKRLNQIKMPIIIYNQDGFYNGLLALMQRSIEDRFMSDIHGEIWKVITDPEELISAISTATSWEDYSINSASV